MAWKYTAQRRLSLRKIRKTFLNSFQERAFKNIFWIWKQNNLTLITFTASMKMSAEGPGHVDWPNTNHYMAVFPPSASQQWSIPHEGQSRHPFPHQLQHNIKTHLKKERHLWKADLRVNWEVFRTHTLCEMFLSCHNAYICFTHTQMLIEKIYHLHLSHTMSTTP